MKTREGQESKALTPKVRAMTALGLSEDPPPFIRQALKECGIKESEAISFLRCSPAPEAVSLLQGYDSLTSAEKKAVHLDHLLVCSRDAEKQPVTPARILAIITEQMFLRSHAVTGMIAAAQAPNVMKSAVFYSGLLEGHQDRKMLLQATGAAPVPKNQSTYVNISGNKIDKSIHISSTPTLESVLTSPELIDMDKVIDGE